LGYISPLTNVDYSQMPLLQSVATNPTPKARQKTAIKALTARLHSSLSETITCQGEGICFHATRKQDSS